MREHRDRRAYACMSLEERERVRAIAREQGLYASEFVREAIAVRPEGVGDEGVREVVEGLDAAGREYNEAAWAANVCARRYGFASYMKSDEYESLLNMLRTCERMAERAKKALEATRSRATVDTRESWFVMPTRRMAGREAHQTLLSVRVSAVDREKIERCARAAGVSPSTWLRMAVLLHADGADDSGRVVTTDVMVSLLMRAAIRWRVNHEQASRALAAVRTAQGRSRFLEREEADEVVARTRAGAEAVDGAWGVVVGMLAPLEVAGLLRGVGLCH